MDFTLKIYRQLLLALQEAGYAFYTFEEYCEGKATGKFVILRHDIDKKPENSLNIADIEYQYEVKSTFYFRSSPDILKPDILKEISEKKHEIGYHYRDLVAAKGDYEKALSSFKTNISFIRNILPIRTISMDGCPLSRYDNRDLWNRYNYHDFGIIGEPYFDVDFQQVFYLTDTGRCWDGDKYSVRDKVKSNFVMSYRTTNDIIEAAVNGTLPTKIMITTHPQRWTDNKLEWLIEFVMQTLKNIVKKFVVRSLKK